MILIAEQKLNRPQLNSGHLAGCRLHYASLQRQQNFAKGIVCDNMNVEVIIQWIRVYNHKQGTAMPYARQLLHNSGA